ncbi:MAG: cell wall hydrolase, partial [Planctomycetota bacterium]
EVEHFRREGVADKNEPVDAMLQVELTYREQTGEDISRAAFKNVLRLWQAFDKKGLTDTSDSPPRGALVFYHTPYGAGGRIGVSNGDKTVFFGGSVKESFELDTVPGRLGWVRGPKLKARELSTDGKPGDAKPADGKPAETRPGETRPDETRGETRPETKPDEVAPVATTNPTTSNPTTSNPKPDTQNQPQQQPQNQPQQQPQNQPQQQPQQQQQQPSQQQPSQQGDPPVPGANNTPGENRGETGASSQEREVMARIVKGEIGPNAPEEGRIAIAAVILTRAKANSRQFGQGIIGVCHKPYQFSCYNPDQRAKLYDGAIPQYAFDAVDKALKGENPVPGCTHYFNPFFAQPKWQHELQFVKSIGSGRQHRHDFYKPKGGR